LGGKEKRSKRPHGHEPLRRKQLGRSEQSWPAVPYMEEPWRNLAPEVKKSGTGDLDSHGLHAEQ